MNIEELFKGISSDDDVQMNVPPKDAAGDTSQKKTAIAVPSTSTAHLVTTSTSTSMGTATATVSLNTETSSNATRKLYNIIYII